MLVQKTKTKTKSKMAAKIKHCCSSASASFDATPSASAALPTEDIPLSTRVKKDLGLHLCIH